MAQMCQQVLNSSRVVIKCTKRMAQMCQQVLNSSRVVIKCTKRKVSETR